MRSATQPYAAGYKLRWRLRFLAVTCINYILVVYDGKFIGNTLDSQHLLFTFITYGEI